MNALCDEYWERELARRSKVVGLEDEGRIRDDPMERAAGRDKEVVPGEIVPVLLPSAPLEEKKKRGSRALAR